MFQRAPDRAVQSTCSLSLSLSFSLSFSFSVFLSAARALSAPFWSVSAPSIAHERTRARPAVLLSFFLSFLSLFLSFSLFSLSLSLFLFLFLFKFIFLCLSLCRARSERAFLVSERAPQSPATELTEFRGAAKRRTTRTRGGQGLDTEPSHRVDRVHGARAREGQQEGKAWTQSPATELTEFRTTRPGHRAQPRSPATELTEFRGAAKRRTSPSHRVDRVQGRGQEEDKAQPQSAATELTEFRGAAKRRTRGGQGPATEPSHRVDRVQGRGQEEDKAQPRSPATV